VVLPFFGAYKGTVYDSGLRWANPFDSKCKVSVRVRNFESEKFKVNDLYGNSIEIAKVVDTAESVFLVDNYEDFVHVQSEAALSMVQMALDNSWRRKGIVELDEEHKATVVGDPLIWWSTPDADRLKKKPQESD
jgi:hypothetical protein